MMNKLGVVAVLLVLQSASGVPAQSPASCRGGIVFDSDRTQIPAVYRTPDVYLISSDGTGERQLTFSKSGEFSRTPSVSPDGQRVVFQGSRQPGGEGLFVLTCADDRLARITPAGSGRPGGPAWSPDGRQIRFQKAGAIFVVNADGSEIHKIVDLPNGSGQSWAPDGTRIAFTERGDVTWEISQVELGSGRVRQLTHTLDANTASQAPEWSPDGKRIAFDRVVDGNFDIYVMNADGTNIVQLTHDPGVDARPTWSPDGRSIAFHSQRGQPAATSHIYTMTADGSNVRQLTGSPYSDRHPDW